MLTERKILFIDLDGTIVDSGKAMWNIYREIFHSLYGDELKYPFSEFVCLIGLNREKFIYSIFGDVDLDSVEIINDRYRYLFREKYLYTFSTFQGMDQLLYRWRKQEIELVLLSNRLDEYSRLILEKCGVLDCFSELVINDGNDKSERLKNYLVDNRINKKISYLIGDTEEDVKSGIENGISTIYVEYGYGELKNAVPDYEVNSVNSLELLMDAL